LHLAILQVATALSVALLPVAPALAQSQERTAALADHTPPQVLDGTAIRDSHYNPDQMLRLVIAVTPPHRAEEEQFIRELTTPGSPNFRSFLTSEEWDARFAPSAADEQKIVDWARSQGLTVTARFENRLAVDLEAPAGVIEKAFGVTLNNYRVGEDVDYSNDRDPVLPASIARNVTAVLGLNNIQRMQGNLPESRTVKGPDYTPGPVYLVNETAQADGDSSKLHVRLTPDYTNGSYDPTDLYSSGAYDFNALKALGHCCNPGSLTAGLPAAAIAIAAFGNVNTADIVGFQKQYPYLAFYFNTIQIDGAITCPASNPKCYNYSGETTLDTEWAIATSNSFGAASNTAHIHVYEGNNGFGSFYDLYNRILSDNNTRVSSTSWSCTETYGCNSAFMSGAHSIFNKMIGMGWTLIAASGDRGATDDCTHTAVAFPGSDTDFVSAGGTTLKLAYPTDNFSSETGWQGGTGTGSCSNNNGGSGGGVSAIYSKPPWQGPLSGTQRLVPDISLNATSGQNIYFNGKLSATGGTSIVDPELAGFFAQENAYLASLGNFCGSNHASSCAPLGDPNPLLYLEGFSNYAEHNPYYDTTSGCNSNDVSAAGKLAFYCAGPGYDEVTGWGSANMLQLAWALNHGALYAYANGLPYVDFTGPAVNKWYKSNQTVSWTVIDYPGVSFPEALPNPVGTGIAGETQSWDASLPDPATEPHGGSGNSFYSGPQYPNGSTGCLSIVAGGCAGSSASQGCHFAHVRGWNNEGMSTGDEVYGPICYDTIPPVTVAVPVPLPNEEQVILIATDASSGVAKTYYSLNNSTCAPATLTNCQTYKSLLTLTTAGNQVLRYFSEDVAGNFEAVHSLTIDVP
jgi:subtilase family serine protease